MVLLVDFIKRQFLTSPPVQTTSFAGRTIIVTGASGGLGFAATQLLTNLSAARIILACRDPAKGEVAINSIRQSSPNVTTVFEVWFLDLLSYKSILAFADRANNSADLPRLDAVCLNAGIRTAHYNTSPEGHECTIQTNVISTALLASLLHPKLAATARTYSTTTQLCIVGSELYEMAAFKERHHALASKGGKDGSGSGSLFAALDDEHTFTKHGGDRYPVTKLLILLFMQQMASLAPVERTGVVINVVAPGFCDTGLGRQDMNLGAAARAALRAVARKPEVGARPLVYGVSTAAGREVHGAYLPDCKVTAPKGLAGNGAEARELRERVWRELNGVLEGVRSGVMEF